MLSGMGIETGIDPDKIEQAGMYAKSLVEHRGEEC